MNKGLKNLTTILLVVLILVVIMFGTIIISNQNKDSNKKNTTLDSNTQLNYPPVDVLVGVRDINKDYGFHPNPLIIEDVNVKRNQEGNYDGVSFSLYSDDRAESINCHMLEYYDSIFNSAFDRQLEWASGTPLFQLNFESNIKPKVVKYDIDCIGEKSGFENKKSLILNIIYPD